ncbi:hypothetical protein HZC08_00240, partial [Candidatus Micrarchaeota archaeon]|nr:hypothetical protein [Candidatus Micrarchaeota archaeon]
MGSSLSRSTLAYAQDIRGGPNKSIPLISKLFCGRPPLDFSSGDLPKCLGDEGFDPVRKAIADRTYSMAYDHPLYGDAQDAIWAYTTGLDPRVMEKERARVHAIPGISGFMAPALEVCAEALGCRKEEWGSGRHPLFVLVPPIHPHWLAAIVNTFGYGAIRTIKRTPNGLPDQEDMMRVFRGIDRPFVVIATP